jgi:hypothetical protein
MLMLTELIPFKGLVVDNKLHLNLEKNGLTMPELST